MANCRVSIITEKETEVRGIKKLARSGTWERISSREREMREQKGGMCSSYIIYMYENTK